MNLQSYYVFCFCLLVLTYNFLLLWVFSLLLTVALIKNDQTDVILVSPRISLYQTLLLQPLLLLYTQNLYCMSADRCSPRNTTSLKFRWSFKIRTPISACVFFPKPLSHSPNTSWVSYSSTQFWHYLPRDSIRFYRLRAQSHKTVLRFRW